MLNKTQEVNVADSCKASKHGSEHNLWREVKNTYRSFGAMPCRIFLRLMLFISDSVLRKFGGLAGVAQWIELGLQTAGLPVQFPVRAHAWVAGQVPSEGHVRGNHTLMVLSLSVSLPSRLSK